MKDDQTRKQDAIKTIVYRAFGNPLVVQKIEFFGDHLRAGKPARHINIDIRTTADYDVIEKLCDAFRTEQFAVTTTPKAHELCLMFFGVTFPWEM